MTSTTLPRMITVRLTTITAHLAVSAELGWHDEARVFDATLCGRPITATGEWQEVTALTGPHRMVGHGPSFPLQPCLRCAAKLAKIVAADHDAAIDEDIRRVLGSLAENDGAPADIADYVTPLPDTFAAGQRVGIVRGVQGVNGPQVYRYGTVVRSVELWMWIGTVEYVVRHDDDGAELVYAAYLLRPAPETANTIGHRATHASRVGAPLPRIRFADGRERQVRDARFGPTHTVLVYAEPHPSTDVFRHDVMITVI
jgi:hypothetical protein